MVTTTLDDGGRISRREARAGAAKVHVGRIGLGTVGLVTVLISAWGGIIPYVGPAFGYSADGTGSWHWSLSHSVLGLVPGALGVLIGLAILGRTPGIVVGRGRMSLAMAGFIALLCGAWFTIGPSAWPVIQNSAAYFVGAAPLRQLENQVGYALGPGLILAICGAFAIGWASRHQQNAGGSVAGVPMPEAQTEALPRSEVAPSPPNV